MISFVQQVSLRAWLITSATFLLIIWALDALTDLDTPDGSPRSPSSYLPEFLRAGKYGWTFNATRDANSYGLTDEQCDIAFPDLWYEVSRAREYWREKGGVQPQHVALGFAERGAMRLRIIDRQLFVMEVKDATFDAFDTGVAERARSTLHQLQRAALWADDTPDIEFSILLGDEGDEQGGLIRDPAARDLAVWTHTRRMNDTSQESFWVIPDFNFWTWAAVGGAYTVFRDVIQQPGKDTQLENRFPKVVWRGDVEANREVSDALLNVSVDKSWSDIRPAFGGVDGSEPEVPLSMPDHCSYMFNVHTEGHSWSGRLKYLLNCRAVTFVHDLQWTSSWYHLLKGEGEEQNIVNLSRDFEDLEEQVNRLLADPLEAQRIANNGAAVFRDRYVTPAAVACYWRRLFGAYAAESYRPDRNAERGIPYEDYIM